jgi:hypothetical protein
MTPIQKQYGPFARAVDWPGMTHTTTCGAADRLFDVRRSQDLEWLQAVIKDRDVQTTVRLAAERRLRKLGGDARAASGLASPPEATHQGKP